VGQLDRSGGGAGGGRLRDLQRSAFFPCGDPAKIMAGPHGWRPLPQRLAVHIFLLKVFNRIPGAVSTIIANFLRFYL
jgi:hypothetical protein